MLKSKIHRAAVTHCELHYEGSCAIDENLLEAANIVENERIDIWNINNGERFTTYAIRAEDGSKTISVNGAAAHKADVGHRLIICTYAQYSEAELAHHKPTMLYFNPGNQLSHTSHAIPVQVA
jgi:aspartate 1-decarboxylase